MESDADVEKIRVVETAAKLFKNDIKVIETSGMMQFVQKGDHPGMSSVMFLPMIDVNPSDATCIYSTLKFLAEHAKYHNASHVVTFDQPLWWKALMIVDTEPVI